MVKTLSLLQILAATMFGEAGILYDGDAAMAVGHVFINRMESGNFGVISLDTTKGFHAFHMVDIENVPTEYYDLAAQLLYDREHDVYDPTLGSLYILSRQDMWRLYPDWRDFFAMSNEADWVSNPRNVVVYGEKITLQLYAFKRYPSFSEYPNARHTRSRMDMIRP